MADEQLKLVFDADASRLLGETGEVVQALRKLNGEIGKSGVDLKKLNSGFESAGKRMEKLNASLKGLVGGFLSYQAALKGVDLARAAADAQQAADAFERVLSEMGLNAEEEFAKIKKASMGLIPDSAIKQMSVAAISLGVPIKDISGLMEIAVAKSREMGITVEKAFTDLTEGAAKGSTEIINNVGITIKLSEAYQEMADEIGKSVKELTAQERQQALVNAVLKKGADSVRRYADANLTAKQELQRFDAQMQNLGETIGAALLPALVEVSESTAKWLETIDPKELEGFSHGLVGLVKGVGELLRLIYKLNDVLLPDWLVGEKGAGVLDTAARGWGLIADAIGDAADAYERLVKAGKSVGAGGGGGGGGSWGEETISEAQQAAQAISFYSEETIKALQKDNDARIKSTEATITKLVSREAKLSADIQRINLDLQQKLAQIEQSRVARVEGIENQIRELRRSTMSEDAALADMRLQRDQELSMARRALAEGDLETYRRHLQVYEDLVRQIASEEISAAGEAQAVKEQAVQRQIDALKTVESLENAYYTKKKEAAIADAKATMAQKQAELEAVKAQLEAQKELLKVSKELAEALTGKKIDLDSSAIDRAIGKISTTQRKLAQLSAKKAKIKVDSTGVDQASKKVESLKTLTLNGVTMEIDADTTPADFGITKFVTTVEDDQITMEVNPEWERAKKLIDEARRNEESTPVTLRVDADTSQADRETTALKHTVDSLSGVVDVGADVSPAKTEVERLGSRIDSTKGTVRVDADTSLASESVGQLMEQTRKVDTSVSISADTSSAEQSIDALEEHLSSIDATIEVDADTSAAELSGGLVKKRIESLRARMEIDGDVSAVDVALRHAQEVAARTVGTIQITADASQALGMIKELERTTYSDHVIRVHRIYMNAKGGLAAGGSVFRGPGRVPGYDPTDSDTVHAMLTRGEFVMPRVSVAHYGQAMMEAIRKKQFPKIPGFADGGAVGTSSVSSAAAEALQPVNITIDGRSFALAAERSVAAALAEEFERFGGAS